ncbi:MAG: acyl-CoA thioesterase [Salinirussus sp.]
MKDLYETVVRFAETDAQGIVFYGTYVTYQDETFTEYMEAVGFPYETLRQEAWDVHVVNLELNFHSQVGFRDRLICGMRIDAIGESSLNFEWACRNAADDSPVADGHVTHVAVDESGETVRVPDEFREAVVAFQATPPEPV